MADDEIGGIRASITADASGFLSTLRQAEAAAKAFDERYGKINVRITATLSLPTQSAIRDYQRDLQAAIDKVVAPRITPPPQARAATTPAQIQRSAPAAAAAEAAAAPPVAVTAAPVIDAAAQARAASAAQAKATASRAQAQATANATGRTVNWTDVGNVTRTVRPERAQGGAVGSAGETLYVGSRSAISFGPQELAGRRGGVRGIDSEGGDFQRLQEESSAEIARLRAQLVQPSANIPRPRSAAQIAQLAAARANTIQQPGTGLFIRRPAEEEVAQPETAAPVGAQPQIRRSVLSTAIAAEIDQANRAQAELKALALTLGTSVDSIADEFRDPAAVQRLIAQYRQQNPEEFEQLFQQSLGSVQRQAAVEAARGGQSRIGPTFAEREAMRAGDPLLRESAALRRQAELTATQVQTQTQVRALGTFIAGQVATAGGRPEAKEAEKELSRARAESLRLDNAIQQTQFRRTQTLQQINDLQQEADSPERNENLQKLDATLTSQNEHLDRQRGALRQVNEEIITLDARAKAAASGGMRNLTASFVGGIAGSLAFGVGITAITTGIEVVTRASKEGIGVLTGWRDLTNETSAAIAKQATQLHGLTEIATANTFAQTALSAGVANTIRPLIEQRVALESGSEAFSSQIDLIHTWVNLRQQQISGGGIPGISTGIGGIAGTQAFAQPGIIEQLSRLTPQGQARERGIGGAVAGGAVGAGIGAAIGLLGGPFAPISVPLGIAGGTAIGAGIGGLVGQGTGPTSPFQFGVSGNPRIAAQQAGERTQIAALQVETLGLAVDDLNEASVRGAQGVKDIGSAITGSTDQAAIDRTQRLLAGLDVPDDQRQRLADAGFVLQDIFSVKGAKDFFEAAARGATVPSSQETLRQLREQTIPARLFQLTATSQLQRAGVQIQAGVQRAAQPFLPLGTTVPPPGPPGSGVPGGLGAVSPELQGALGAARGIDRLSVQRIQAARVEIANLALPGERAGAVASFDRLQGLGQQAAGLQTFITQSQVNLATNQYNEQLRQARLQMGDLAVLTGRVASSGGDNLGVLEKQNIQLQRANSLLQIQLSTLQLELQQRQINFQVAIAGFAAPGTTPAEIAARQREAELEASYAQKQLDIQKEILANQAQSVPLQIQIQDIQFSRDYISARNAIDLLTEGRQVTIDTAAAQEALQRINSEIEAETANLNTFIQAGQAAAAALISDAAQYIATYKTSTQTLQDSADEFFSTISDSYATGLINFLTRVSNYVNTYARQAANINTYANAREGGGQQTGFYGQVSSPTHMLVGEAGAETVAILRNPREMTWNGGGGGGTAINLTIMVTGNNVRSDQDIDNLTNQITRKVEEALSRRTSLLGFRPS